MCGRFISDPQFGSDGNKKIAARDGLYATEIGWVNFRIFKRNKTTCVATVEDISLIVVINWAICMFDESSGNYYLINQVFTLIKCQNA